MTTALSRAIDSSPRSYPERIVQFGGGNFLRGFVDWAVDILNEEAAFNSGIALVKATPGRYAALDAQDCLFTTCLHGIQDGAFVERTRLIRALTRTIYPYEDFAAYLALARQRELRFIFSNTTEAGIIFDPDDRLEAAPPKSFPAKLTRFLYERYQHFRGEDAAGCIIIPTELIDDNGRRLRAIVLQYAALWRLEPGFAAWIRAHNPFYNTLVDRIIPGFPAAEAPRLFAQLGYEDRLLVAGEIYHSWIIEAPPSLLAEFPITSTETPLNIKIVADAAPYRITKVRLLNGAHTSMVPLGLLLGIESVRAAVEHEALGPFLRDLIYQEVIPSVSELPEAELKAFANDVFERFRNPHIHHRLLTIALNSSAKVKERLLPSILGYQARRGALPPRLILALAAFIRLYKGEWRGESIALNDDPALLAWFQQCWREADSTETLAHAIFANEPLWGRDLTAVPGLVTQVGVALSAIEAGALLERLRCPTT